MSEPVHTADYERPVSWFVCDYCGAGRHEPCCTASGVDYPMGVYHADRKLRRVRALIDGDESA